MTIDNHCGGNDQFDTSPASHAEAHSRIALEQSALYAARLAIARWITASAPPAAVPGTAAPVLGQANWYAQSQQQFQEWLARGGFAQYEDDRADLVAPTMYSIAAAQPSRTDIPSAAA